jgi:phage gpG-like protein
MSTINASIQGADRALAGLSAKASSLPKAVQQSVQRGAFELVAHVKQNKLSGQVLQVRTGALRRSINAKFENGGDIFKALVGTNLKYARIHEYGFEGAVSVKAHQRMMKTAWGKPVKLPRKIDVRAHVVNMKMKARPFMQPALAEKQDVILGGVRAALTQALKS